MSGGPASVPVIEAGRCHVLFAYDLGMGIDLDKAERLITENTQRDKMRHRRRAPRYFEYRPLPLRVTQQTLAFEFAGFHSEGSVDLVLYDFGAVSVNYSIPLSGPLDRLLPLSDLLYDNPQLQDDSLLRVQQLLRTVQPAVSRPLISDFQEDYIIFEVTRLAGNVDPEPLCREHGDLLARILRSETTPMSGQQIEEALAYRISFAPDDLAVIDWNASLVFASEAEDVRMVLEFANVELLEMRYLDQQLDDALDEAYVALSAKKGRGLVRRISGNRDTDHIARLQVDSALLFENVNNALKLLGDQYLARVYRLVSERLHLAEWDASILRKLETIESIYTKVSDRASVYRMEVLEFIIIALIFVSIILPFIPGMPKH